MELNTYFHFNGTCESAMRLYERVLGGRIVMMMRFSDAPAAEPASPETANLVMHARLQVGNHYLMASDAPPGHYRPAQGFCTNVSVDTPAEAERIFRELAEGGTVTMPIAETFWAHRFGMLVDRFGTPWMVNCEKREAVPAGEGATATQGQTGTPTRPFVISRTFDAPRNVLWRTFTDAAEMQRWWGPKGVEIVHSKMDFRPGGTYHYGMKTPDGKIMWGRMLYRTIEPQQKIHFVNLFSDENGGVTRHPLAPSWPLQLLSTFEFAERNGKTTLTVTWTPLNPTPEEQAAFDAGHASMQGGWTGTLDRLQQYLDGWM